MERALRIPRGQAVRNLMDRMGRWLPRSPGGSRTVIALGSRWLKVLHVSGRGASRRLDLLLAQPIAGKSDEEILSDFRQGWEPRGLDPGEVLVANPSALTTVRIFTLPSTDPKEIRDIVELQVEKHTPYGREEILTDSAIVDSNPAGYSRVLVAISHQEVVHRALRVVEGMGWALDRVGFELDGLSHWFRKKSQPGSVERETLVAELDGDATAVTLFQKGKPCYHRSLALGGDSLREDPSGGPARLSAEFQRSMETFEAEGLSVKVSQVVLTGQADRFPALAEAVQQVLGVPVEVVPALEPFPLAEGALSAGEGGSPEVSFASLAGLALGEGVVDLTPATVKLRRTFEIRSRALVKVGCQIIAGFLLVSCWMMGRAYENQRYLAWLSQEHERLGQEAGLLTSLMDQMRMARDWVDLSAELLEVLDLLQRNTPPTVRWNQLTYSRQDQISLRGTSPEIPKVFDFVAELRKSPRFSEVEVRRTSMTKLKGEEVTEFEILCRLAATQALETEGPEG